jgi:hypothetical protein
MDCYSLKFSMNSTDLDNLSLKGHTSLRFQKDLILLIQNLYMILHIVMKPIIFLMLLFFISNILFLYVIKNVFL